nr:hypothetical protein [Propionibacterium sp.]
MNPEPQRRVTAIEVWLAWAEEHGVRYDGAGKSSDDVARDFCQTSDVYRGHLTPEARGDVLYATHKAAANTAYAGALLVEAAIQRRGGDVDLYDDPVQVRDPHGQIMRPQQKPEAMEWGGRGAGPVRGTRGTRAAARRTH